MSNEIKKLREENEQQKILINQQNEFNKQLLEKSTVLNQPKSFADVFANSKLINNKKRLENMVIIKKKDSVNELINLKSELIKELKKN